MNKRSIMDADSRMDYRLQQEDDPVMPLPSIDSEPHILISKVRKIYFQYIIDLLSLNYEKIHKLQGKGIHLPSAIWRCAKTIEMDAARSCMIVELYRRNILIAVKELQKSTNRGKIHKMLLEYLQAPVNNDKKTQTNFLESNVACRCKCICRPQINNKKFNNTPFNGNLKPQPAGKLEKQVTPLVVSQIPVVINQSVCYYPNNNDKPNQIFDYRKLNDIANTYQDRHEPYLHKNITEVPELTNIHLATNNTLTPQSVPPKKLTNQNVNIMFSVESQDTEDDVMLQMEQLFRSDPNEIENDIFETTLFNDFEKTISIDNQGEGVQQNCADIATTGDQAAKIKSLDDRLALLESTGVLNVIADNPETKEGTPKRKPHIQNIWLCENYFMKQRLYEKLDEIRDRNRRKHMRIKTKLLDLFGEDSDDEQVMSPLEETPEFVRSCKERIAPWIVKLLTPHYVKGRIKNKALFKAVAKHLLKLIYQCSKYPSQYEVCTFVTDFLKNHPKITCNADYMSFRIDNI